MKTFRIIKFMKFIIFLIFLFSNSFSLSENLIDYEEKFIISSSLNLRNEPSFTSKIVMQIPYGTKVYVKKTNIKYLYNGELNYWYLLENTKLYLWGSYLSDKKPKKQKIYKVTQNYGWEGCPDIQITLYLNNMEAELSASFNCHQEITTYKQYGSYLLMSNFIEIKLNDYTSYSKQFDDGKITKKKNKGEIIYLYWLDEVQAWLAEEDTNKINFYLINCKIRKYENIPYIDCCEYYKKILEAEKDKTEWDEIRLSNWKDMCYEKIFLYSK